jgi:hypothetical protein
VVSQQKHAPRVDRRSVEAVRALHLGLVLIVGACNVHSPASTGDASNQQTADASANHGDAGRDGTTAADAPMQPIAILEGVDRAGAFSTTEAAYLKTTYNVMWTGVYIGGACSAGSGWSKSVLTALNASTGWSFLPIWVGQQASSICGRDTLTAAQGTTDGAATAAEMQVYGWAPDLDIPVVLDLEGGTYSASASEAQAYAQAWRDAVQAGGYLAYLYSSSTAIDAFDDAGVAFDGVWPADWLYTAFDSNATPADVTTLGSRYPGQTRAWQYAGNVTTSGAGGVDSDVSDLLLAPAPGGTNK